MLTLLNKIWESLLAPLIVGCLIIIFQQWFNRKK